MDIYYDCLANLQTRDFQGLFSDELQEAFSEGAMELKLEMRKMQEADYSLLSYKYTLQIMEIMQEEQEIVFVLLIQFSSLIR